MLENGIRKKHLLKQHLAWPIQTLQSKQEMTGTDTVIFHMMSPMVSNEIEAETSRNCTEHIPLENLARSSFQ